MIELTLWQVALGTVPAFIALILYWFSIGDWKIILWATFRMIVQLIAIGYALTFIFELNQPIWVLAVITFMSFGAAWIATRSIGSQSHSLKPIFIAVVGSGFVNLVWIIFVVIQPESWFEPRVVIPIAGMVFANTMNAVSLAAERYWAEIDHQELPLDASKTAFRAALIPQINALLAVGLVSLPGMMTGQILSGISPLIAVRYQIVIMSMILATAALGSFVYLKLVRHRNPI